MRVARHAGIGTFVVVDDVAHVLSYAPPTDEASATTSSRRHLTFALIPQQGVTLGERISGTLACVVEESQSGGIDRQRQP